MCSASRIASWPTRRTSLGALEILTGPRVDLDLVSRLHEKRHVDLEPGLERRGLRRPGRRVALETEVRRGDGHHDGRGHVDTDRVALAHVPQLHADLRAAAPHLDVLELDDLVELAVDLDRDAALDLPGAYHCFLFSSMSQRSATS